MPCNNIPGTGGLGIGMKSHYEYKNPQMCIQMHTRAAVC